MRDLGDPGASMQEGPLVGRGTERKKILQALTMASGGKGSMILIEGEAGLGKTHLISHCAKTAREKGFTVLWGKCLDYRRSAHLPYIEMLKDHFGISALDDFRSNRDKVKGKMKGAVLEDPNFLEEFSDLFIPKDEPIGGFKLQREHRDLLLDYLRKKGFRIIVLSDEPADPGNAEEASKEHIQIGSGDGISISPTRLERIARMLNDSFRRYRHCAVVNDAMEVLSQNNPEEKFTNLIRIINDLALENGGMAIHLFSEETPTYLEKVHDLKGIIRSKTGTDRKDREGIVKGKLSTNELFSAFFMETSRFNPLLIILEDLQWSDKSSLNLLQYLARDLPQESICILGSFRPEDYGFEEDGSEKAPLREALQRISRERLFEVMVLDRLDEREQKELVQKLLGKKPDPGVLKELLKQAGGNPMFIIQYLKDMDKPEIPRDRSLPPADPIENGAMRRRLTNLDENARNIIGLASVIGMDIGLSQIMEGLKMDEEEVLDKIDDLIDLRLVQESGEGFKFVHPQARLAVLSSIDPEKKEELHLITAGLLEERITRDGPSTFSSLADHFRLGGLPEKALKAYVESAEWNMENMDGEAALSDLDHALECLDKLPRNKERNNLRIKTLQMIGDVKEGIGDTKGALIAFKKAAEVAEKESIPFGQSSSYRRIGDIMLKLFEWDQTVDYYLRSLHLSKKEDDQEEVAKSFRGLGTIYFLKGDYPRSMECYLKYLEFPKKERRALNVLSMIEIGEIYYEMGDFNQALTYFKLAIRKGEEAELKQESALAYIKIANLLMKLGEVEDSRRFALWGFNIVSGHPGTEISQKVILSFIELMLETADIEKAEEGLEILDTVPELDLGDRLLRGQRFRTMGLYLAKIRDFEGSGTNMDKALEIHRSLEVPFQLGLTCFQYGLIHFQQMKVDEAIVMLKEASKMFKSINAIYFLNRTSSKLRELTFIREGLNN